MFDDEGSREDEAPGTPAHLRVDVLSPHLHADENGFTPGKPVDVRAYFLGFCAFWTCELLIWYYGYLTSAYPRPLATAVFDTVSWMTICVLGMVLGFFLPLRGRPTLGQILLVVFGAFGVIVFRLVVIEAVAPAFGWIRRGVGMLVLIHLPRHILIATTCVGLGWGLRTAMRVRQEQDRLDLLDSALLEARLAALRTNLRPRILLNAMQSIADDIGSNAALADRRLVTLGDFLRLQLFRARVARVRVEDEIQFIEAYVVLENASSPGLQLTTRLARGTANVAIPTNSIATLVESALRVRSTLGGDNHVDVTVSLSESELSVAVKDDCRIPVSERCYSEDDAVRELTESITAEFGAAFAPAFHDVPGGVLCRLRMPRYGTGIARP